MGQNFIEKIVQRYSVNLPEDHKVRSGEFVTIRPVYVMTHDNTGAVIPKFKAIGAEKIHSPGQVVFTLDHDIQNKSETNLAKYKNIENFALRQGNDFYPAGTGIGHQIMIDKGYIRPGSIVVASDSHSNTYGGLGVLGTPVVRTDAAAIWATGKTWWQIPPVTKVVLSGGLNKNVSGKDIILALCGTFNNSEVLNTIVEFSGKAVKEISVEQRLTIANMTTEWGALGGVFPVDEITLNWIKQKVEETDDDSHPRFNREEYNRLLKESREFHSDDDALYFREIEIDLHSVYPVVNGPQDPKTIFDHRQKKKIDKAYLLSCTNGRLEDFKEASSVLNGKKISDNVKMYISAASAKIQKEAEKEGYWQILLDAGVVELPSGCGPCIGLGKGLLEDGETGISATNRNFKGRMGSRNAEAYLASPATVAYSALKGYIFNPYFKSLNINGSVRQSNETLSSGRKTKIIKGFPGEIKGRILFCDQDNMNTDLIYPGKYTYNDNLTPEDQAKAVMENYDPQFSSVVREGDLLVSGYNFGSGSSREQAATAIKYAGIRLLIAGSFSNTYLRNAINNGFLCLQIPGLVNDLRSSFPEKVLTRETDKYAVIDFYKSVLSLGEKDYSFTPVGEVAQKIILSGGLENFIKNNSFEI